MTTGVVGVNTDLRVRPFFAQGGTISIREFLVGAFNAEMGIQSDDADLRERGASTASAITTPAGMVLDGAVDAIEAPPVTGNNGLDPDGDGIANELPIAPGGPRGVLPAQLLQAGRPACRRTRSREVNAGRTLFTNVGCNAATSRSLTINVDRRVADVETVFSDSTRGARRQRQPFNRLFATATPKIVTIDDPGTFPVLKQPARQSFVVNNIFTDFKRHDLGDNFAERNFDGTFQRQFMTEPLWGVGTTAPYGHDGRSQRSKR